MSQNKKIIKLNKESNKQDVIDMIINYNSGDLKNIKSQSVKIKNLKKIVFLRIMNKQMKMNLMILYIQLLKMKKRILLIYI